jgi:hypothetical protein
VPDEWLTQEGSDATATAQREAYVQFLVNRLAASETFVQEADNARKALI